jgi:hypothetical protein
MSPAGSDHPDAPAASRLIEGKAKLRCWVGGPAAVQEPVGFIGTDLPDSLVAALHWLREGSALMPLPMGGGGVLHDRYPPPELREGAPMLKQALLAATVAATISPSLAGAIDASTPPPSLSKRSTQTNMRDRSSRARRPNRCWK